MFGFKVIPGFEKWCVTKDGKVFQACDAKRVKAYKYGDRLFCSYPDGKVNKLIGVHVLVALAWVENDNPEFQRIVNHKNGDPMDNWHENLEWTDYSGNNYHAVNTGLRSDNVPCKIRDFYTKEIREFPSIAQAADFMGLPKDRAFDNFRPKKFGKLILERYEIRLLDDPEPFFYENRPYIISPARYMVTVTEADGKEYYFFNLGTLLQRYQLYGCPEGKSIPALVAYGNKIYPDKKFTLRDAFAEYRYRNPKKKASGSRAIPIVAKKDDEEISFSSLTEAARYFNVDRDVVKLRLSNPEATYLGWSFEGKPCFRET